MIPVFIINKSILLPVSLSKTAEWVANSVDPDQMPHSVQIHRVNTEIFTNQPPSEIILDLPLNSKHYGSLYAIYALIMLKD